MFETMALSIFFFTDPATTMIYTLSLHDALPILPRASGRAAAEGRARRLPPRLARRLHARASRDRKSTRLNSSHMSISYAVFCLKKKKGRYRLLLHDTQHRAVTAPEDLARFDLSR